MAAQVSHALQSCLYSCCCFLVAKSCSILGNPMDCSMPAFPVLATPWIVACQPSLSWQPHGLQHARLPCPSLSPRVCSNSCPSSWWYHPTISTCHPLLLLPSVFPSIRVFSNELALRITWPKYWNFSFRISHSDEYSGLISFRVDWFDLLAVQGTLKSLLFTTAIQKHQFFSTQPYLWSSSHIHTWLLEKS